MENIKNSVVIRYPSVDDYEMLENMKEIEEEIIPFPFSIKDITSSRGLISSITSVGKEYRIRTIYKLLKKNHKSITDKQIIELFKPLIDLRKHINVNIICKRYRADFCMMVPPCVKLNSTADYLGDKSYDRHHLVDGIHGALVVDNLNGMIYEKMFGSKKNDWKGLFLFDKDYLLENVKYLKSSLSGRAIPVHADSEFGDVQHAQPEAVEFDGLRASISDKICDCIKENKISFTGLSNDTSMKTYKALFDELYAKCHDITELYYTQLGLLMPHQNKLEINLTGFGKIPVIVYPKTPRPIFQVDVEQHSLNESIILLLKNLNNYIDILDFDEYLNTIKKELLTDNNFLLSILGIPKTFDHGYFMAEHGSIYSSILKKRQHDKSEHTHDNKISKTDHQFSFGQKKLKKKIKKIKKTRKVNKELSKKKNKSNNIAKYKKKKNKKKKTSTKRH